jgi:hypothetical protein
VNLDPVRLTRSFVLALGVGLLLDGVILLVLGTSDINQSLLNLVTGLILLAVGIRGDVLAMWAAVVFGAFSVALGVIGLTISQPFGMQLGLGENVFHFVVGVLALLLGAWALRTSSLRPTVPLRNGVLQGGSRSVPVARRRARRRPGTTRGHRRRR